MKYLLIIVIAALSLLGEYEEPFLPPPPVPAIVVAFPSGFPDRSQEGHDRLTDSLRWYGGRFFLDEEPNIVYVYMKDVTMVETARHILHHNSVMRERGVTHIAILQGRYSTKELRRLSADADHALYDAGIETTGGGMKYESNTFEMFLAGRDMRDDAEEVLRRHGIPLDSVTWTYPKPKGIPYGRILSYLVMLGVLALLGLATYYTYRLSQGGPDISHTRWSDLTPHLW